jgi:hypothetical protein
MTAAAAKLPPVSAEAAKVRYKLHSDASITKRPPEGMTLGSGQLVNIIYDGSKGKELFYQLFYTDPAGAVHPLNGGAFKTKENNLYSQVIEVSDPAANGRPGFIEIATSGGVQPQGTALALYDVKFQLTK